MDALATVDSVFGSTPVGVAIRRDSMFMFCNTLNTQTAKRTQMYSVKRDLRIGVSNELRTKRVPLLTS